MERLLFLILLLNLMSLVTNAAIRRNGKIAFTSTRDGNPEIYVMNPDGTDQVRLTSNSVADDHATWSPDGRKIAFLSQTKSGAFAIFLMNADGTGRSELSAVNYQPPVNFGWDYWAMSWSPDGRNIAFQDKDTSGYYSVYVMGADGSGRHILTSGGQPAWSPDGSKILFSQSGLSTINLDGTNLRAITPDASSPAWSPNGDRIVFQLTDYANWEDLEIANADGSDRSTFANGCSEFDQCGGFNSPDWSPDGSKIVFHLDTYGSEDRDREIWVQNVADGRHTQLTNSVGDNVNPSWQAQSKATFDFDGDGRSDVSVFRPDSGVWYLDRSTQGFSAVQFGISTDKIVPADFDADGKTDVAVYRDGVWWRLNSSDSTVAVNQFGIASDIPVPGDYTGDGRDEIAVYRSGQWWTLDLSNGKASVVNFGFLTDKPVPADYDGDGRTDAAVYRDGTWYILGSQAGFYGFQFGRATDKPVPADYDGDGRADPAVNRGGTWYLLQSTGGFTGFVWGLPTDLLAPADYDGDGKMDAAVYRDGTWWVWKSTGGYNAVQFGLAGDTPLTNAYVP